MFRLYSKGCEYAFRALIHVVEGGEPQRFVAAEVCEKADIPEPFTRKVFQALVQGGFLVAVRGPGGGYCLKKRADEITLLELIKAVDGEDTFDHCILGLPSCGGNQPCPLHEDWAAVKGRLLTQLESKTLADLVEVAERDGVKASLENVGATE